MADENGPRLVQPIPRRPRQTGPFEFNLDSPTPPEEPSEPSSPNLDANGSLLNPNPSGEWAPNGSLSRSQSIAALMQPTLVGIFGAIQSRTGSDEPNSPFGTGAATPIKRNSLDDSTYELMKARHAAARRPSSSRASRGTPSPRKRTLIWSLALRMGLLFLVGMGYGVLVKSLRVEPHLGAISVEGITRPDYHWTYLAVWGASGVALGALLPWVDGIWESSFGSPQIEAFAPDKSRAKDAGPRTDVVVRSVGAFMGIVYALRKLQWDSTLEVSVALALANPFLWYLVDRSKPGFLLSAAVGLTGSALLIGINPDMMPMPMSHHHRNLSTSASPGAATAMGGLASQETLATGIWMLSVLFCSCVCFGNVGRRLALNTSAATGIRG